MTHTDTSTKNDVHSFSTFASLSLIAFAAAIGNAFAKLDPRRIVSYLCGTNSNGAFKSVVEEIPEGTKQSDARASEPRKGYFAPFIDITKAAGYLLVTATNQLPNKAEIQAALKSWADSMTANGMSSLHLGEATDGVSYSTYLVDLKALEQGRFSAQEARDLAKATLTDDGKLVRPASKKATIESVELKSYLNNPKAATWTPTTVPECHSEIVSVARVEWDRNAIVASALEQAPIMINISNPRQPSVVAKGSQSMAGHQVLTASRNWVVTKRSGAEVKGYSLFDHATAFSPAQKPSAAISR